MSEIDNTLKANRIQAEQFGSELGRRHRGSWRL